MGVVDQVRVRRAPYAFICAIADRQDEILVTWAFAFWRNEFAKRRKDTILKRKLAGLREDLGVIGMPFTADDEPSSGDGAHVSSEAPWNLPVAGVDTQALHFAPDSRVQQADNIDSRAAELEAECECLRGRCEALEKMAVDASTENRTLREESKDGEAGLDKAMDMLQRMRKQGLETRRIRNRSLRRLSNNVKSLVIPPSVARVPASKLDTATFLRDYVARSQPVVVTDLNDAEWPCLKRWTDDYLLSELGDSEVPINVTPNGLGDAVDDEGRFIRPKEEAMRFAEFWQRLEKRSSEEVLYLSKQDDCLRTVCPQLLDDVPAVVPLGLEAFGNKPDAVNLWIGDERSVTSCHKDHYDNLFTVVRGEKIFTLLPPAVAPFMHESLCRPGEYMRTESGWSVAMDPAETPDVPWIPVNVADPDLKRFPDFARASAITVHVGPGEMLYLPAMWYHHVAQKGLTIGVNYWHDMQFDAMYCYNQYVRESSGLDLADDSD